MRLGLEIFSSTLLLAIFKLCMGTRQHRIPYRIARRTACLPDAAAMLVYRTVVFLPKLSEPDNF